MLVWKSPHGEINASTRSSKEQKAHAHSTFHFNRLSKSSRSHSTLIPCGLLCLILDLLDLLEASLSVLPRVVRLSLLEVGFFALHLGLEDLFCAGILLDSFPSSSKGEGFCRCEWRRCPWKWSGIVALSCLVLHVLDRLLHGWLLGQVTGGPF